MQGDSSNYFLTAPLDGISGKYRFWVTGDCGTNYTTQTNVKNQYLLYNANRITNGWLLLGDNAYNSGTNAEYNLNFFAPYKNDVLKNIPLWPAPGNHDYANSSAIQLSHNMPYYNIFSLPSQGECGGIASNNTAYYSFNYGNVHFVSLDSYGFEQTNKRIYDTLSNQVNWLKQDLAANALMWTVVYFHHPPYTLGTHTSETEIELVKIRENLNPILERYNVDFVFSGHSHTYERSKLLKGHFGNEASFSPTLHLKSTSSGTYDGTSSCPYVKDTANTLKGTIYAVNGTAGKYFASTEPSWPHDAMQFSNDSHGGAQILDVEENRVDLKWLCDDGVVRDKMTMFKNVNNKKTHNLSSSQTVTLTASWPGKHQWNTSVNDTLRSIVYTATTNTTITVTDNFNCITDTFLITISTITSIENENLTHEITVSPNPSEGEVIITQKNIVYNYAELYQYNGALVMRKQLMNETEKVNTQHYSKGFYILKLYSNDGLVKQQKLFFE